MHGEQSANHGAVVKRAYYVCNTAERRAENLDVLRALAYTVDYHCTIIKAAGDLSRSIYIGNRICQEAAYCV